VIQKSIDFTLSGLSTAADSRLFLNIFKLIEQLCLGSYEFGNVDCFFMQEKNNTGSFNKREGKRYDTRD
jgi:hypothetical protein